MGVFALSISGGEIFLRHDICEIIEYIRMNGFSLSLMSNCSLIEDGHIQYMAKYGVESLIVTIYGASEDTYEEVTGVRNFKEVSQNLLRVHEAKIPITINIPTLKTMIHDYEAIRAIAAKVTENIKTAFDLFPIQFDSNQLALLESENADLKEIVYQNWLNSATRTDEAVTLCKAATEYLAIGANGDIRPCSVYPEKAGNIFNDSIQDVWYNSSIFKEIREVKIDDLKCSRCALVRYCDNKVNCIAYSAYYSDMKTDAYERICERAEMNREYINNVKGE